MSFWSADMLGLKIRFGQFCPCQHIGQILSAEHGECFEAGIVVEITLIVVLAFLTPPSTLAGWALVLVTPERSEPFTSDMRFRGVRFESLWFLFISLGEKCGALDANESPGCSGRMAPAYRKFEFFRSLSPADGGFL